MTWGNDHRTGLRFEVWRHHRTTVSAVLEQRVTSWRTVSVTPTQSRPIARWNGHTSGARPRRPSHSFQSRERLLVGTKPIDSRAGNDCDARDEPLGFMRGMKGGHDARGKASAVSFQRGALASRKGASFAVNSTSGAVMSPRAQKTVARRGLDASSRYLRFRARRLATKSSAAAASGSALES